MTTATPLDLLKTQRAQPAKTPDSVKKAKRPTAAQRRELEEEREALSAWCSPDESIQDMLARASERN